MKITFIYPDLSLVNNNRFNLGIAQLSACLKKEGFDTSLLHITRPILKDELIDAVKLHSPDLIAFSSLSMMFSTIKKFASWVKELDIFTIYGGIHPTVSPEESINCDGINAICRSEGDEALVEFCSLFRDGKDISKVPNFWVKSRDKIYRNPIRSVLEDLDKLPYVDYCIFDYPKLKEGSIQKAIVVQASRGCFYNCTYCSVHLLRSLVPNKKKYLRWKSVDNVIAWIKYGLSLFPFIERVFFQDDTLTYNKEWFRDFAERYREEIGLPFQCNDRVNNITKETSKILKNCGCERIDLGIESGNNHIRNNVMKKHTKEEEIINAFHLLRVVHVEAVAFNIFGMPHETCHSVLDTIKLNAKANPCDYYNSYFYPFIGTEAYNMVLENNYKINTNGVMDFLTRPLVDLDTISKSELVFFHKYFRILVRIYRFCFKIFGAHSNAINVLDRILISNYFPHYLLGRMYFSRDRVINYLQKYPRLYLYLREFKKRILR